VDKTRNTLWKNSDSMAKKRPTVAEKKWMQQVADYGCIACEKMMD
jgi:hypothetical protein